MRTVVVAGVALAVHERADWQADTEPVTGPSPFPDQVHTCVAHYPGASKSWVPPTDVAAHLRAAHHSYLVDPDRGYSYGYSFVIGPNPFPDIWEVRGFDIRNAANNGDFPPYSEFTDPSWNGRTVSIQIMCSWDHPPTPDQVESFRYCLAMCDDFYGETLTVQGHKQSDFTDCPGPMMPMLPELATRPTEDFDLATADEIKTAVDRLEGKVDDLARKVDTIGARSYRRDQAQSEMIRERYRLLREQINAGVNKAELVKALNAFEQELS